MSTVEEYHKSARDCLRWAAKARTEEQRKQFLSLAHDWTQAAFANGGGLEEIMNSRTNSPIASTCGTMTARRSSSSWPASTIASWPWLHISLRSSDGRRRRSPFGKVLGSSRTAGSGECPLDEGGTERALSGSSDPRLHRWPLSIIGLASGPGRLRKAVRHLQADE
jgi:hypothetical protein